MLSRGGKALDTRLRLKMPLQESSLSRSDTGWDGVEHILRGAYATLRPRRVSRRWITLSASPWNAACSRSEWPLRTFSSGPKSSRRRFLRPCRTTFR